MTTYEYEKYCTTSDDLKTMLDTYGVAIIPSVLTEQECSDMLSGIWKFLEHITQKWDVPIKRNKKKSWHSFYDLHPLHSMMLRQWDVGHAQVAWDVRQNEKIVNIFAKLWNCTKEELLVSFDGMSFNIPPEVTKKGWNDGKTWYHTDQSYLRNDFECIQSWMTALDVNEDDATLTFMEGSHAYHSEFRTKYGVNSPNDWYKLTSEEEQFYVNKKCEYKKIKCPKGSLVLWDSRTIHCGAEAMKTRKKMNFRAIIYLCYTPRIYADTYELTKKQHCLENIQTTNHWPHKINTPHYGKNNDPLVLTHKMERIDHPILNDLGKKLAGL